MTEADIRFNVVCSKSECMAEAVRRRLAGAYSAADPGIQVEIWGGGFSEYTIPGHAVVSV